MTKKSRPKKPWNKGKIVGGKTALKPEEVQAIRVVLTQPSWPERDRVLFAVGIDSCLRGADLVRLRVSDLMLAGEPRSKITIEPSKTAQTSGARVTFTLAADTKELLRRYIANAQLLGTDFLFANTKPKPGTVRQPLTERAYANRVKRWIAAIGLTPDLYGTHSVRKVQSAEIYRQTGNLEICRQMLGHRNITTTQKYLGVEEAEVLETVERFRV